MIRFITYSADNMTVSRQLARESARSQGAQDIYAFSKERDISQEFYTCNKETLDAVKGAGYWLPKPYFVNRVMNICEDGDILIYGDAGVEFIAPFQHIIDVMDQDVFLFSNGHQHKEWCKMDVMCAICPDNYQSFKAPTYVDNRQEQVQASVIFFRVNAYTRRFVKEWLLWCQMPGFITDEPSKIPNVPTFAEHRYDQAIITCLAIREAIRLHWWADKMWYESQRYRWPSDQYPSMFLHHRKRNRGTNNGNPEW